MAGHRSKRGSAPLSRTSLNKWGAGIADTVGLGIPPEAVYMGVPVVVMPFSNRRSTWCRGAGTPAAPGGTAARTRSRLGVSRLLWGARP